MRESLVPPDKNKSIMRTRVNRAAAGPKQTENAYAVELVYRIKLLRLAFGFSQAELSFLLGYPTNRVQAIEDFSAGESYALKDLINLSHIFECPAIRFLPQSPDRSALISIRTSRKERNGKYIHEAWECTGDGTWELLWKLPEQADIPRPAAPALFERTRALIRCLVAGGYFNNPWEAFEIYKACRQSIGNQLRPLTLKYGLLSFLTGGTDALLRVLRQGNHVSWVAASSKEPGS